MEKKDRLLVAIIDYGMGNLFSVKQACEYVGLEATITSKKELIEGAGAVILPGVGAFGEAMGHLNRNDLISPIRDFIQSGRPFMGICLGMQLLFSESEEFGRHKGLNIIEGTVVKFNNKNEQNENIKVPQVGWNQIFVPDNREEAFWFNSPLQDIRNGEYMYFVHSYYPVPVDKDVTLSITEYEEHKYCSSLLKKNVFACQFHPEKSAYKGVKIYHNWVSTINFLKEER